MEMVGVLVQVLMDAGVNEPLAEAVELDPVV
jgi:hypothetical protein